MSAVQDNEERQYTLAPDELAKLMLWIGNAPAAEVAQVVEGALYNQASRRESIKYIVRQVVQMLEGGTATYGRVIKQLIERDLLPESWAS